MLSLLLVLSRFLSAAPTSDSTATLVDTGKVVSAPFSQVHRPVRQPDSLLPMVLDSTKLELRDSVDLGLFAGFRIQDSWYRLRAGMGDKSDSGFLTSLGVAYQDKIENQNQDSTHHRRSETLGYQLRLQGEKYFQALPRLAFYLGIGVAYDWLIVKNSSIDTVTNLVQTNHYPYTAQVHEIKSSSFTQRAHALEGVFGIGLRVRTICGLAVVGGVEFGPEWTSTETTNTDTTLNVSGSEFSFRNPSWSLGFDLGF